MKTKTMRTVAAALSALCLCTAAIAPTAVSAATIKINDSVNVSVANRTFSAYKIFDVEVGTAGGEASYKYTIVDAWKSAITGYGAFGLSAGATNDQIVEKITALTAAADIQAFANYLKNQVAGKPAPVVVTADTDASTVDITVPTAGYYLVLDTSNAEDFEVISAVMLDTITDTVPITLKADAPTLTKKIWEDQNDDGTVAAGELFDANTASIGDTVNYYLTSRVPDTQYYTSYTFKITDTFDAGLTYNGDVAITVGGETLDASAYTVGATGQVLTITFNDMKALGGTDAGDEIAVTYSATVNENAAIGTSGNENVANLLYSNDPSSGTTKETADDVVVTYLGEFQIYKTNNAATPAALAGAEFTLYSDSGCTAPIYLKATATADTYQVCASTAQGAATAITTSDSGRLIIRGLKAGTYYIKETDAPDGYNPISKVISMTLTATEDSVAITNTAISHAAGDSCEWSYAVACDDTNVSGATNVITVVNKSGSIFPNTGGIGTTIFTVGGLVLMIGAAGLFLIKRMKNSK